MRKIGVVVIGIVASALICYLDYRTGPNMSVLILYFIPVSFALWFAGSLPGILVAILSMAAWIGLDRFVRHPHSGFLLTDWNWFRAGMFVFVAYLLSIWKSLLDHQSELANADSLTGLANRRSFTESALREIRRASRYRRPLTVVFVDVDDFKKTNDSFGHAEGDRFLCAVARVLRDNLRVVDFAARLGGDEFAVLLPDINSQNAPAVIEKLHERLTEKTAQSGKRPVTFSVGGVTFERPPATVEAMMHEADRCMYNAKKSGKNSFSYQVFSAS